MTEAPEAARTGGFWWYLRGRSGRAEYWALVALIFGLSIVLSLVPALSSASSALVVPLMFAQIRRVHDFGRSGWWAAAATFGPLLLMFPLMAVTSLEMATLAGIAVELALIVVIGVIRGDPDANRFGPPAPFSWRRTLSGR